MKPGDELSLRNALLCGKLRSFSAEIAETLSNREAASGLTGVDESHDVDSDLSESISLLKDSFAQRGFNPSFGAGNAELIENLRKKLNIPRRYREFLMECNPLDVETVTPSERVRLIPAEQIEEEQRDFALTEGGELISQPSASGWRPGWIIIAHSSLLGDPYFLDTSSPDAEGDCPVYTAMSGTDIWKPRICASSFALFIGILGITMQVAQGFSDDEFDVDDEHVFRESLGPKIRELDPAALKAGHWT